MAIAFDAVSDTGASSIGATPNPGTWTHTPVGTPRAVVVMLFDGVYNGDLVTGVTYGGVSMTRVTNGYATLNSSEPGSGYFYFLGSGIPTGAQTVAVSHTGTTAGKWGVAVTFTADSDCEVLDSATIVSSSQANPTYTYDSGSTSAIRLIGGLTGDNSALGIAAQSGSTILGARDSGTRGGVFARESSAASGSSSAGMTIAADDVAMVCAAIAEASSGQPLTGSLFQAAPTFFTGSTSAGSVDLGGALFQVAPTFNAGSIAATYQLDGTLFQVAPSFFTGSTTGSQELTGALFQVAPTFSAGTVTPEAVDLVGTLLQVGPTFPQGAVAVGAVDLAGNLFVLSPSFFAGDLATDQILTGTLAQFAPSFFAGDVTSTVDLDGALFQAGPSFFSGSTTTGPVDLAGVLFQVGPSFFVASLTGGLRPRRRTTDIVGNRADVSTGSGRVSTGVSVNRKTGALQ